MNLYFRALKYIKPYLFRGACAAICTAIAKRWYCISAFDYQGYGGPGFKRKRRSAAQLYRYQHHRSLLLSVVSLIMDKAI